MSSTSKKRTQTPLPEQDICFTFKLFRWKIKCPFAVCKRPACQTRPQCYVISMRQQQQEKASRFYLLYGLLFSELLLLYRVFQSTSEYFEQQEHCCRQENNLHTSSLLRKTHSKHLRCVGYWIRTCNYNLQDVYICVLNLYISVNLYARVALTIYLCILYAPSVCLSKCAMPLTICNTYLNYASCLYMCASVSISS